jgi:hypothetical protein
MRQPNFTDSAFCLLRIDAIVFFPSSILAHLHSHLFHKTINPNFPAGERLLV